MRVSSKGLIFLGIGVLVLYWYLYSGRFRAQKEGFQVPAGTQDNTCIPTYLEAQYVELRPTMESIDTVWGYLQLSQIQIKNENGTNIAVGKSITASNTISSSMGFTPATPTNVVSGNINEPQEIVSQGKVWVSTQNKDAFWKVNLGSMQKIKELVYIGATSVFQVQDNSMNLRNKGVTISFFDSNNNEVYSFRTISTDAKQTFTYSTEYPVLPTTPKARYIRVQPRAGDWLGLSQLKVMDDSGVNIAAGKPVTASAGYSSSTEKSGLPGVVVSDTANTPQVMTNDTNTSKLWHSATTTSAGNEFWQVDLGSTQFITKIQFIGRELPGYESRNMGVRIKLLDENRNQIQEIVTPRGFPTQTFYLRTGFPSSCQYFYKDTAVPCPFIAKAAYVRIRPSTLDNGARSTIELSNIIIQNITGGTITRTISQSGGTLSGTGSLDGKKWRTSSTTGYIDANLGGTVALSKIIINGTNKLYDTGKNPFKGMRIQLLNSSFKLLQEFQSRSEANVQSFSFCTDMKYDVTAAEIVGGATAAAAAAAGPVNKTVVDISPTIKCSQVSYDATTASSPRLSQWLCNSQTDAMNLVGGPSDKTTTYLRKGDEICIKVDSDGKKYSCYDPYSPEKRVGDYEVDTIPYEMLDTNKAACDIISKSLGDLSGSLFTIGKMSSTASTNLAKLIKAEGDLVALYDSMNCSEVMPQGRARNLCMAVNDGRAKIFAERDKIEGLNRTLANPATASASARTNLETLKSEFGCGT